MDPGWQTPHCQSGMSKLGQVLALQFVISQILSTTSQTRLCLNFIFSNWCFQMKASLEGADVVVIPAGVPRKPGMTRDDLFNINASIVANLCTVIWKEILEADKFHLIWFDKISSPKKISGCLRGLSESYSCHHIQSCEQHSPDCSWNLQKKWKAGSQVKEAYPLSIFQSFN